MAIQDPQDQIFLLECFLSLRDAVVLVCLLNDSERVKVKIISAGNENMKR